MPAQESDGQNPSCLPSRLHFGRDFSGRLTLDRAGIDSLQYPEICRAIAEAFGLVPEGELVVGPDQMFRDYRKGDQVVSIDWDIWMEFMVVAKTESAEPLVKEIGAWFGTVNL